MGANNSSRAAAERIGRRHGEFLTLEEQQPVVRVTSSHAVAAAVVARRRALLQAIPNLGLIRMTGNRDSSSTTTNSDSCGHYDLHMPLLYSLARSWAWGAVTYRCQTHPQETKVVDCFGDTVLHWSVFGRPPVQVVEAILMANPGSAQITNHKGQLPLHMACSYRASADVLAELLRVYPQAAGMATTTMASNQKQRVGSYPLHLLCDFGGPVECIRLILQTPGGVHSSRQPDGTYRRRPLQILNARKNIHEFQRMLYSSRQARKQQRAIGKEQVQASERDEQQRQQEFNQVVEEHQGNEFWQKAAMLALVEYTQQVLPAHGSTQDIVNSAAVLRACVGNPQCPCSIQELSVLLNYDKLDQPDEETGNLPLHIAASSTGNASVIRDLLEAYPQAAGIRNKRSELPLSILLRLADCGWQDGIGSLLKAFPLALADEILDRRLYPLVWARLSSSSDAIYQSLRSRPDVLLLQTQTDSVGVSINSVMA